MKNPGGWVKSLRDVFKNQLIYLNLFIGDNDFFRRLLQETISKYQQESQIRGQERRKRPHCYVKQLDLLRHQRRWDQFSVDSSSKIDAVLLIPAQPSGHVTDHRSSTVSSGLRAGRSGAPWPQLRVLVGGGRPAGHFLSLRNFKGHLAASVPSPSWCLDSFISVQTPGGGARLSRTQTASRDVFGRHLVILSWTFEGGDWGRDVYQTSVFFWCDGYVSANVPSGHFSGDGPGLVSAPPWPLMSRIDGLRLLLFTSMYPEGHVGPYASPRTDVFLRY